MISDIEYSIESNPNDFNDDKLKFKINNVDEKIQISFVNSIRRTIEESMEAYNLSDIDIKENDTIFHDDLLIQRLNLFPINYNKVLQHKSEDITVKLDIENKKDYPIVVKSKDLKFYENDKEIDNLISYENIILVQNISPGQKIQLVCQLHKDFSNVHASYKHTCKNLYHFKIDEDLVNTKIKEESITDEKEIIHYKMNNHLYKKTKSGLPETYIYELESNGVISVKESLKIGIEELILKIESIVSISETDKLKKSLDNPLITIFELENETHTIGNLLSQYCSMNKLLEGCTYLIPHPLDNILLVKFNFIEEKNNTNENCILILKETCDELIKLYKEFLGHF